MFYQRCDGIIPGALIEGSKGLFHWSQVGRILMQVAAELAKANQIKILMYERKMLKYYIIVMVLNKI